MRTMATAPYKQMSGRQSAGRALGLIALASLCGMLLLTSVALANEVAEPAAKLTDPMRPNWYGLKAKSKQRRANGLPKLSSIIASAERRLAVINGSVMREGEQKDGVLLRQVLPDRVLVVTADQRLHALKLKRPQIGKEQ